MKGSEKQEGIKTEGKRLIGRSGDREKRKLNMKKKNKGRRKKTEREELR